MWVFNNDIKKIKKFKLNLGIKDQTKSNNLSDRKNISNNINTSDRNL